MKRRIRSIDILSGLPDEVLCHILSFLPTKTSVSTSVLAKRWRFLWTHVPYLRFYKNNFRGGNETQPLDIISRVAMLHQAEILNTFKLSKVKGCPSYQLDTLIIYLTKRNLRNLHLDFGFENVDDIVCTLPILLFICKTLVDLKLVNCGLIPSSGELFLPSLKKLNLSCVEYADDESLPHLLSGCPVLEELIVKVCFREEPKDSNCVTVSSPTIKKLIVDFSLLNDEWNVDMLIIDVPALVYLKVDCCCINRVKSLSKSMTSLIEAEITLNRYEHDCSTDCTKLGPWDEFLSCLCQVRYLKISSYWDMAVHLVGTGSMTKFVNITKLELEHDVTINWYNLVKFLEVADNLEVLIISIVETLPYIEPKRVPPCMLSRLRTVTLSYFDAREEDYFGMVRYILRNAQVLERMEIFSGSTKKKIFDALRRILLFERGSTSCQVAFNTY